MSKSHRCNAYFERTATGAQAPFSLEELIGHLSACSRDVRARPEYVEIAAELDRLVRDAGEQSEDLENLEQRLTQLETNMIAIARAHQTEAAAMQAREELEKVLAPYRKNMTHEQLTSLEHSFLERRLLESFNLPRLSLFYMMPLSRAAA